MQISDIAAKQKRLKDWSRFLAQEDTDEQLELQLQNEMKALRSLLLQCWENKEIRAEDRSNIENSERKLEQLFEELRLHSRPEA